MENINQNINHNTNHNTNQNEKIIDKIKNILLELSNNETLNSDDKEAFQKIYNIISIDLYSNTKNKLLNSPPYKILLELGYLHDTQYLLKSKLVLLYKIEKINFINILMSNIKIFSKSGKQYKSDIYNFIKHLNVYIYIYENNLTEIEKNIVKNNIKFFNHFLNYDKDILSVHYSKNIGIINNTPNKHIIKNYIVKQKIVASLLNDLIKYIYLNIENRGKYLELIIKYLEYIFYNYAIKDNSRVVNFVFKIILKDVYIKNENKSNILSKFINTYKEYNIENIMTLNSCKEKNTNLAKLNNVNNYYLKCPINKQPISIPVI